MQYTYHHQHQSPWKPALNRNHQEGFRHSVWTSWCVLSCQPYTPQRRQLAKSAHSAHCPGATAGPGDRRVTVTEKARTATARRYWHDSQQPLYERSRWKKCSQLTCLPQLAKWCGGTQGFWILDINIICHWMLRKTQMLLHDLRVYYFKKSNPISFLLKEKLCLSKFIFLTTVNTSQDMSCFSPLPQIQGIMNRESAGNRSLKITFQFSTLSK